MQMTLTTDVKEKTKIYDEKTTNGYNFDEFNLGKVMLSHFV